MIVAGELGPVLSAIIVLVGGVATLVCGFGLYVHCKVFASSS
jgi:hypothetical protein